jgi:hypothetical protein
MFVYSAFSKGGVFFSYYHSTNTYAELLTRKEPFALFSILLAFDTGATKDPASWKA